MAQSFDLTEIKKSLESVKANFDWINDKVYGRRETMTDELIANILEAYQFVNGLLEKKIELFTPAGMYSMLELNHIVLCGTNPKRRKEYFSHIEETRTRFQRGIIPIMEWYKKKGRELKALKMASIFYTKALSQPQLFVEGNHRTENIIVNYILVTKGKPPFVIDSQNAIDYFNPSTKIKFTNKYSVFETMTNMPGYEKEFRKLLETWGNMKYLSG